MLTLIRCPFHSCVTAVARKRPRALCQKCRWQVTLKYAYTLNSTKSEGADNAAVQAQCENLSGNELTLNSSGNTRPQSSQLAEPLWTDPGITSGIYVRDLLSTLKKAQAGNELSNVLHKSSQARKKPPPRQTGFGVIIRQCVASDRNIACDILISRWNQSLSDPIATACFVPLS